MPERRLRRFAQLEQSRPSRPEDNTSSSPAPDRAASADLASTSTSTSTSSTRSTSARFDGLTLEPSAPGSLPSRASVSQAEPPTPEPTLELASRDPDAQPFLRCCHCHVDSARDASACRGCAASLSTPEQLAFNEAYWAEHRTRRASHAERREQAQRDALLRAQEVARENRALYEGMAREVGDDERRRLAGLGLFTRRTRLRGGSTIRLYAAGAVLLCSFGVASCGARRTFGTLLVAVLLVVGRSVLPPLRAWLRAREARRP